MSAITATRLRPWSPYCHPNLTYLSSSELLLGSTHSLPLLESNKASNNASRSSMESAHTTHATLPRNFMGSTKSSDRLPSIRLHAAPESAVGLGISMNEEPRSEPESEVLQPVRRTISPLVDRARRDEKVTSVFDWQYDNDAEEDPDSICPLQRQPKVGRGHATMKHGNQDAGEESSKAPEKRRQNVAKWEQQMRAASCCDGQVCWSTAYAGNGKQKAGDPKVKHHEDCKKRKSSGFWRRLTTKLGLDKWSRKRARSEPLPQSRNAGECVVTKTVTQQRAFSAPDEPRKRQL